MSDTDTTPADTAPSRAQFVAEEKAKQLDKGVEYLATKNAELQYDLNRARASLPDTHVAIPKEDAAALTAYREQFPTPKEAAASKKAQAELEEKDTLRSYDEKRAALLAKYPDLPDGYKGLILTAEELSKRPGGKELLRDLALLETDVERAAKSYGATAIDPNEKDVGASPAGVQSGRGNPGTPEAEGKKAAASYFESRYPSPNKGV